MKTLTTTAELAEFCALARSKPYVTIDTEFLRERTYYSKLCLIQMAVPDHEGDDAVLVDPLVGEMSLDPLYDLFRDTSVVKVFHAARQDLEIFFVEAGVFPDPLFDTQVAAMVCGFGEQVGYCRSQRFHLILGGCPCIPLGLRALLHHTGTPALDSASAARTSCTRLRTVSVHFFPSEAEIQDMWKRRSSIPK